MKTEQIERIVADLDAATAIIHRSLRELKEEDAFDIAMLLINAKEQIRLARRDMGIEAEKCLKGGG